MDKRTLVAIKVRKGSKYENKEKGKHGLLYCPEMGPGAKLNIKGGLSLEGRPRVLEEMEHGQSPYARMDQGAEEQSQPM